MIVFLVGYLRLGVLDFFLLLFLRLFGDLLKCVAAIKIVIRCFLIQNIYYIDVQSFHAFELIVRQ